MATLSIICSFQQYHATIDILFLISNEKYGINSDITIAYKSLITLFMLLKI